jgi:hypothetical protein
MKRITLSFGVALLTFLSGVAVAGHFAAHPRRSAEKALAPAPVVADSPVKVNRPEGWKKIEVKNAFSFYIPPDMEPADAIGCPFGVRGNFGNQSFGVGYDYIPKSLMEYMYRGRMSCEFLEGPLTDQTIYRIAEIEIGGRRAREIFRQWDNPKRSHISVCFPDLGDGALLRLGAGSEDERAMEVAKQVVDSVEFH